MKNSATLFLLLVLVLFHGALGHEDEEMGGSSKEGGELFMLQNSKRLVKTDAGEMTIVRTALPWRVTDRLLHIGFITMEPKTLFVPQYIDTDLVIFIRRGEANLSVIYDDELVEKRLKIGDIYRIPAGSAFYLVNTGEGQRLHCICSIDASETMGMDIFRSYYVAGGVYPQSILSGFDPKTLSAAFNISVSNLTDLLTRQQQGPIMYMRDSHSPSSFTRFLKLKHLEKMGSIKKEDETGNTIWSWRKLLGSIFWSENADKKVDRKSPDSYNLYDEKPDFKNNYGWSIAVDEDDYSPLNHSGVGVYLVNLTAGSMMAPHMNPMATEYGVVLSGSGTIQIVFPNGSTAMNTRVNEGDVFFIPKYFPFCQIASRSGNFEFFGFTTSAHRNRPQFFAGKGSVLHTLRGPELASAFGMSEDELKRWLDAQKEAVIFPSEKSLPSERPEGRGERPESPEEREEKRDVNTFERFADVAFNF